MEEKLGWSERALYKYIKKLDKKPRRCTETNKDFGEFLELYEGRAGHILEKLERLGYVKITYVSDDKRLVSICENRVFPSEHTVGKYEMM